MQLILIMRGATFQHASEASKMATKEAIRETTQLKQEGAVVADLCEAFRSAQNQTLQPSFAVREYDIKDNTVFSITQDHLILTNTVSSTQSPLGKTFFFASPPAGSQTKFPLKNIALVIKRTIGDASDTFLAIAEKLDAQGIKILNGVRQLNCANSKISQFNLSTDKSIFPETLCVDNDFFSRKRMEQASIEEKVQLIIQEVEAVEALKWPLVLKPAKGSRAKGILLIEDFETLRRYLLKMLADGTTMLQSFLNFEGLLLQNLIPTDEDATKSVYYRVNVVGKEAQSAVRFEYVWTEAEDPHTKELVALTTTERPINLKFFNSADIQKIIEGCALTEDGVVGMDVLIHKEEGKTYFLEFNTTPIIHTIVAHGQKLLAAPAISSEDREAAECCINFPHAIVQYCLKILNLSLETASNLSTSSPIISGVIKPQKKSRALVGFLREIATEQGYEMRTSSGDWLISLTEPISQQTQHIFGYGFSLNSQVAATICDDKAALSDVLTQKNVPHIAHKIFVTPRSKEYSPSTGFMAPLMKFAELHHWDLVLKPKDGSGGHGVVRCRNAREMEAAAIGFFSKDSAFVASPFKQIKTEYRVIFLEDEVVLIYAKVRPTLCGDGIRSVRDLLLAEFIAHKELMDSLKQTDNILNLNLDSIPTAGEIVPIIWKHNLGAGAEARLETDPTTVQLLEKLATLAVDALNLKFVSVDIVEVPIQKDQPYDRQFAIEERGSTFEVIEINSGVMMEKAAQYLPNGEHRVKTIYAKAIEQGFAALRKTQQAHLADEPTVHATATLGL